MVWDEGVQVYWGWVVYNEELWELAGLKNLESPSQSRFLSAGKSEELAERELESVKALLRK